MKSEIIRCDRCGNKCTDDYFSIYQITNGEILAKEDVCPSCFNKESKEAKEDN